LAEDDGEFRELLSWRLRGAGYEVTEASDGHELLERLIEGHEHEGRQEPFDVVLSDINMPHFSALDVMVGARRCLTLTPVILMTAFGDSHTHEQASQLGAAAVLDKPFQLDELSAAIARILAPPAAAVPQGAPLITR
jgi:CheY-like chemotaxis protein